MLKEESLGQEATALTQKTHAALASLSQRYHDNLTIVNDQQSQKDALLLSVALDETSHSAIYDLDQEALRAEAFLQDYDSLKAVLGDEIKRAERMVTVAKQITEKREWYYGMKERMAKNEISNGDYPGNLIELATYDGVDLQDDCEQFLAAYKETA